MSTKSIISSALKSAVYRITCVPTGKVYVGSAVNVVKRWTEHRFHLNRCTHCNRKLQSAWNKYSPDAFVFDVLERTEPEKLIEREQYYIDSLHAYHRKSGFNLSPTAGSCLGTKRTPEVIEKTAAAHRGRKRSEETRARISAAKAGRPRTEKELAHLAKMSDGNRGKRYPGRSIEDPPSEKRVASWEKNRERLAVMNAARRGKPLPKETRAKIASATRETLATPEIRAKLSIARRRRALSPESIEKTAAAHRGMKRSAEARAKMTQAQLERWRRRRALASSRSRQIQGKLFE